MDNIDETLLNEYVDVFKNVSSTKWIEILLAGGMKDNKQPGCFLDYKANALYTVKMLHMWIPISYLGTDWFLQQKDLLAQTWR